VVANPASPQAAAFRDIAKKIAEQLGGTAMGGASIESLLKKIKQPFTNQ
jgi:ATP-binding protein involved in chromosome partitioning